MEQQLETRATDLDPIDQVDPDEQHRRVRFGIVREVFLVAGLWLGYRQVRHLTRDQAVEAFSNARQVIDIEQRLHLFNEQAVQRVVLHSDVIIWALNHYYARVHLPLTAIFAIWLLARHREWYRVARTWLVTVTSAGLVIHVTYPLAPPRMMPQHGFVDTLRDQGFSLYRASPATSFANQFAAMPSLHFGWAVIVAVVFVAVKRTRKSTIAFAHPAITLLAIIATANHYWLDAIVALILVIGAYGVTVVILRRFPDSSLQERIDEPLDAGRVDESRNEVLTS